MATANTPTAGALTAAAGVASVAFTVPPTVSLLTVFNRTGAGEVFITLDGSTPTVGGANQWFLPAIIGSVEIPVIEPNQSERAANATMTLYAISAAALSIWIESVQ